MHHIISYYLAQARMADLRHHAERDTRAGSPSRDQASGPRASDATEWPARAHRDRRPGQRELRGNHDGQDGHRSPPAGCYGWC